MTTLRPVGIRQPQMPPEGICLPFEPEYPPDNMFQDAHIRAITHQLRAHFDVLYTVPEPGANGIFISSTDFICYDPDDLNVRLASDCTIAFGVNLYYLWERNSYVVHEVGNRRT